MQLNKFFIIFLALIFVGLAGYYVARAGYYPVATVNSEIITARELNYEFLVAYQYYGVLLRDSKEVEVESKGFRKEIRRAALQDLIEKALIDQELKKRVGGELADLVEKKVKFAQSDPKILGEAARLFYGLNLSDFRNLVLKPQAERELLESHLFLEKTTLDKWLSNSLSRAGVRILTPEFTWNKGRVE